jgi:carbon-monoxide dehydrogenase large subunit
MNASSKIGDAPKRREDDRFLKGAGAYLDDLIFDNLAQAVFVRSPHPHAMVTDVDTAAARRAPGVLAILTIADADADGLQPMRPGVEANVQTGEKFAFIPQPLLARDRVRFVGEPVALVVAETRAQAMDAAELVGVDYEPLPAVTSHLAAQAPGAPTIADAVPGNLCLDWRHGNTAAVDAAFASAAHVVTHSFVNHRIVTNPMEPRGVVGSFDPAEARYTAHVSAQATTTATSRRAGWGSRRTKCGSSHPTSAAASAPRT